MCAYINPPPPPIHPDTNFHSVDSGFFSPLVPFFPLVLSSSLLLFSYLVVRRRLHARRVHSKVVRRLTDDALRPRLVLRRRLVCHEGLRRYAPARHRRLPRHGHDGQGAASDGDGGDERDGNQEGLGSTGAAGATAGGGCSTRSAGVEDGVDRRLFAGLHVHTRVCRHALGGKSRVVLGRRHAVLKFRGGQPFVNRKAGGEKAAGGR